MRSKQKLSVKRSRNYRKNKRVKRSRRRMRGGDIDNNLTKVITCLRGTKLLNKQQKQDYISNLTERCYGFENNSCETYNSTLANIIAWDYCPKLKSEIENLKKNK